MDNGEMGELEDFLYFSIGNIGSSCFLSKKKGRKAAEDCWKMDVEPYIQTTI